MAQHEDDAAADRVRRMANLSWYLRTTPDDQVNGPAVEAELDRLRDEQLAEVA